MAGNVLHGSRNYQEIDPDITLDKVEIESKESKVSVTARSFREVIG